MTRHLGRYTWAKFVNGEIYLTEELPGQPPRPVTLNHILTDGEKFVALQSFLSHLYALNNRGVKGQC
jgi:hypothetical protein